MKYEEKQEMSSASNKHSLHLSTNQP